MIIRIYLTRIIILVFMILVGYSIANSIKHEGFLGFFLALISLGAGISFIYFLNKARQASESEIEDGS